MLNYQRVHDFTSCGNPALFGYNLHVSVKSGSVFFFVSISPFSLRRMNHIFLSCAQGGNPIVISWFIKSPLTVDTTPESTLDIGLINQLI